MKSCFVLLLTLACTSAWGQITESRIHSVELSPEGATIHRSVSGSLENGQLRIEDLPALIDPSALRLEVLSPEGVQVTNFHFSRLSADEDPRQNEITARLDEVTRRLADLWDESKLIDARIQYSLELAVSLRESLQKAAEQTAFELAKQAWEEHAAMRTEARSRQAELDQQIEALQEEQTDLQEQLKKALLQNGLLEVDFSVEEQAEVALDLSYHASSARWRPLYEIRADPASGELTVVAKAQISQETGEDWKNVSVRVSTASPQHSGIPELEPFFLGQVYRGSDRLQKGIASYAPPPPASAKLQQDTAELGRTTTSFHASLPASVSLESGADEIVREISRGVIKADFWSQAVPDLSPDAWLMAGGDMTLNWPVLEAQALVFIDGHLTAKRQIESLKPGEEFKLALGKNENIAIQRTERRRNASEGGVFDKTRRVDVAFETVVQNFMRVPHRVVLQDQFPVSRENKIQVRQEEPGNVTVEEGTGIFEWERVLQPVSSATMTTRYVVTYPAEWTINGDF